MLRLSAFAVLATSAAALFAAQSAAAQGYTTRIEPRPFYGAVVTLEEGVRVIRPLPPERQVIINPGNKTPLSLGFNETRVYERRVIENYNSGSGDAGPTVYGGGGAAWGVGRGFRRGQGHQRPGGF